MVKRSAFRVPTKTLRRWTPKSKTALRNKIMQYKFGTIDEILEGGAKVKQKYGITKKEIAAKIYHEHMRGKIKDLLSPMAAAATAAAIRGIQSQVMDKRPTKIPFEKVGLDFLSRTNTPSERSDPKASPVSMEEMAAPSIVRIGDESRTFLRKIAINPGKRSKMLTSAMNLYGTKTDNTLHTSGYNYNLDQMFGQAGINRKGVYSPLVASMDGDFDQRDLSYDSRGTVTKNMRRNFLLRLRYERRCRVVHGWY